MIKIQGKLNRKVSIAASGGVDSMAVVVHLKEALGTAARMAGDAFWNLPMPKHWDRDEAEYSNWCSHQSARIKSKIQNLQDKTYV